MIGPVFDITTEGAGAYGFALTGVLGVVIGWALAFRPEFYIYGPPHMRRFGQVVLGFSLVWIVVAVGGTAWRQHDLRRAMSDGRASIAEGPIEDFVPMSPGCHAPESFRVAGHRFAFRDCEDSGGFNRASTWGGPLHEGQPVRIVYLGRRILRLEILADGAGERPHRLVR